MLFARLASNYRLWTVRSLSPSGVLYRSSFQNLICPILTTSYFQTQFKMTASYNYTFFLIGPKAKIFESVFCFLRICFFFSAIHSRAEKKLMRLKYLNIIFFLWIKKKNSLSWACVENTSHVRLKFINMILDSSIIFHILLTFSITSVKLLYIVFPFLLS